MSLHSVKWTARIMQVKDYVRLSVSVRVEGILQRILYELHNLKKINCQVREGSLPPSALKLRLYLYKLFVQIVASYKCNLHWVCDNLDSRVF